MAFSQPGPAARPRGIKRREGLASGWWSALDLSLLFLRVAIIVTAWLGLFLAAFFGYLTVPFVVLILFIAAYAALDRFRVRRRREIERRKRILAEPAVDPILGSGPGR